MAQALPPGIAGFEAQRAIGRQTDATQLQGILQSLQAANTLQTMQEAQQTAPLKRGLLEAQTANELQKPDDRVIARENTKQLALSRMDAQAKQFYDNLALRQRMGEDALTLRRDAEAFSQQDRLRRSALGEAAGAYNFGYQAPPAIAPTVTSAAPMPPQGALAGVLAGRPPEEQAAIQAAQGGGTFRPSPAGPVRVPDSAIAGGPVQGGALANLQPAPMPAPAPIAPSMDIPSQVPVTPASMSMAQSGGVEGRFPPVGTAAQVPAAPSGPAPIPTAAAVGPAMPTAPVMPQFSGSPREVNAARNKWLLEQNKTGSAGAMMGDFTKTGKDFLETIPLQDRKFIENLANYNVDPKTLSTRGGEREKAFKQALQFDPAFDQKNYNMIASAINRFGTGKQGDTVRSLNVAIDHMETARQYAEALKNGDVPSLNRLGNEIATQTGKAPPTTFDAVKDIVANEVVKGVIGNAGAVTDRDEAARKLKASSSPEQFAGVLEGWTKLLGGQVNGFERQYEGSTNRKDFRTRYLLPRTQEALNAATGGGGQSRRSSDKPGNVLRFDAQGNMIQ